MRKILCVITVALGASVGFAKRVPTTSPATPPAEATLPATIPVPTYAVSADVIDVDKFFVGAPGTMPQSHGELAKSAQRASVRNWIESRNGRVLHIVGKVNGVRKTRAVTSPLKASVKKTIIEYVVSVSSFPLRQPFGAQCRFPENAMHSLFDVGNGDTICIEGMADTISEEPGTQPSLDIDLVDCKIITPKTARSTATAPNR